MIRDLLENKTPAQRAVIKGRELAKIGAVARTNVQFSDADIDVQIVEWQANDKGVAVYARAWDADGQIGFGTDGTVDLERFVFVNPPILYLDPTGDILRQGTDYLGNTIEWRLTENPTLAMQQSIAHTIKVSALSNPRGKIVANKRGSTTTTVYPDAGDPGSTSVDGFTQRAGVSEAWSTLIAGAGTFARSTDSSFNYILIAAAATTDEWRYILRSMFLFDTSGITDTDTISAATLSLFGTSKTDDLSITPNIDIYTTTPASNTTLASSDHGNYGTTSQTGSPIAYSSWSTTAYNDFSFNATGIGNVDKTGVSKFGARNAEFDVADSAPTWTSGEPSSQLDGYYADQTGTSNDPKLVVVQAAASTFTPKLMTF